MLSAAEIGAMRETVNSALPDTCTIRNETTVSDGAGGHTVSATTSLAVACRIAPRLATGTGQLKDAEVDQAGRLLTQAPWLVTMPYGTVLNARSRIDDTHGRSFEVFAVLARRSDELHTTVLARLINEGVG